MPRRTHHLFGPVPSRRLGRSLGIELVPHKICNHDCLYCECGATTELTSKRRVYAPTAEVLAELDLWLAREGEADFLTYSGAGEPTLHAELGRVIRHLAAATTLPQALLTNGTLLADPEVLEAVQPLAVILPSLDAADEVTFQRINRPAPGLTARALVDGLIALRRAFRGQIWLEVLLLEGVNDHDASLDALARAIQAIAPDRVQVNTAVRPGTEPDVGPASRATLARALARFGPRAEAVAAFAPRRPVAARDPAETGRLVLAIVRRRPETVAALAAALGLRRPAIEQAVAALRAAGEVRDEVQEGVPHVVAVRRDGE